MTISARVETTSLSSDRSVRFLGPQAAGVRDRGCGPARGTWRCGAIGGRTRSSTDYALKALYQLGRVADARRILYPMPSGYATGQFQGFGANGLSRDWRDWQGGCHGYEGLLVNNYHALLAALDDHEDPAPDRAIDPASQPAERTSNPNSEYRNPKQIRNPNLKPQNSRPEPILRSRPATRTPRTQTFPRSVWNAPPHGASLPSTDLRPVTRFAVNPPIQGASLPAASEPGVTIRSAAGSLGVSTSASTFPNLGLTPVGRTSVWLIEMNPGLLLALRSSLLREVRW